MRLVIQRVTQASVTVSGSVVGAINKGYLVLVGIGQNDTEAIVEKMADKMMRLRIFSDENDKINLSLQDVGGQLLLVSQFTLYADCRKGNRPSFTGAGAPDHANRLYEYFMERCRMHVEKVAHGEFGADMKVDLLNDGPFTLMLDSKDLLTK